VLMENLYFLLIFPHYYLHNGLKILHKSTILRKNNLLHHYGFLTANKLVFCIIHLGCSHHRLWTRSWNI